MYRLVYTRKNVFDIKHVSVRIKIVIAKTIEFMHFYPTDMGLYFDILLLILYEYEVWMSEYLDNEITTRTSVNATAEKTNTKHT